MAAKYFLLTALIPLFACCATITREDEHKDFADNMCDVLNHMKVYTLETYDMAPDSLFYFRPVPEVMSFEEQTAHVITNLHVQTQGLLNSRGEETEQLIAAAGAMVAGKSRAELRSLLAKEFDDMISAVRQIEKRNDFGVIIRLRQFDGEPEKDLMSVVMMMRDHVTHHRAQMIVYLRLMGIKPPDYVPF